MRKRAIVLVSPDLLVTSLHFPYGVEVLQARVDEKGDIELVLEHHSLPEVPDGNVLPLLKPQIQHTREHFKFYWSSEDAKNGKEVT